MRLTDVLSLFVVSDGIATVLLWYLLEWQMFCQVVDVITFSLSDAAIAYISWVHANAKF